MTRYPSQTPEARRRKRQEAQALSARTARRHAAPWTAWDDYVLLYDAGTLLEHAQTLERSYHAVVRRRQDLLDALRASQSAQNAA